MFVRERKKHNCSIAWDKSHSDRWTQKDIQADWVEACYLRLFTEQCSAGMHRSKFDVLRLCARKGFTQALWIALEACLPTDPVKHQLQANCFLSRKKKACWRKRIPLSIWTRIIRNWRFPFRFTSNPSVGQNLYWLFFRFHVVIRVAKESFF